MSIRTCDRCTAISASTGAQCKLRTCKVGPYCWIHTRSLAGLQVKPSGIPGAGLGLYTTRERKKTDKKVVLYTGIRKNKKQIKKMKNTDYVMEAKKNSYIDASRTNSGPARYINECLPEDEMKGRCGTNARFYTQPATNRVNLETLEPLDVGSEIFASYGEKYWKKKKKAKTKNNNNNNKALKKKKKK